MNKSARELDAALRRLSPQESEKIPTFFLRDIHLRPARWRWRSVAAYLASVVVVNLAYLHVPFVMLPWVGAWSVGSILVGGVFIARDYAQRDVGARKVLIAMAIGIGLTAVMSPGLALASGAAFAASEGLEAFIFGVTRRPFRERVVCSATPSVVLDSLVFLALAPFPFSWALFLAQVVSKLLAVLVFIPVTRGAAERERRANRAFWGNA